MLRLLVVVAVFFMGHGALAGDAGQLSNQGFRAAARGHYEQAAKLYSLALQEKDLEPSRRTTLLNDRGVVLKNMRRYDEALRDFTAAIALRGDHGRFYTNRGMVYFLTGNFPQATVDFDHAMTLEGDKASPYHYLWLALARMRAGGDGQKVLADKREWLTGFPWPGGAVVLHLDGLAVEKLLARTRLDDIKGSMENECDAYFHLGEYHLIRGNKEEARRWFAKAVGTRMTHLNEYVAAEMEMLRLDGKATPVLKPLPAPPVLEAAASPAPPPAAPTPAPAPKATTPPMATPPVDAPPVNPPPLAAQNPPPAGGNIWQEPHSGLTFVRVAEGCFAMGCGEWGGECNGLDEHPVHDVCLDSFWMATHETTQAVWEKVMGNNPSHFSRGEDYPVEMVSLRDVERFIATLQGQNNTVTFRLPTEAEWEYACRSGGRPERYAGGEDLDRVAWWGKGGDLVKDVLTLGIFSSIKGGTHPVGGKAPNALGLYDMSGNVWEWVNDRYALGAYSEHAAKNPLHQGGGPHRVIRGGGWNSTPDAQRCVDRSLALPEAQETNIGFRLVFTGEPGGL